MPADSIPFAAAPMTAATVLRLLALNRQFYDDFAGSFAESRGPDQPGLVRALDFLPVSGRLLDVGCGNGRLAQALDRAGRSIDYLGIDSSGGLLASAWRRAQELHAVRAEFLELDVTEPDWETFLPAGQAQAIALLAVLHHLPSFRLRCAVLTALRRLLEPQGVLVVSVWQFVNDARLQRKVVPWAAAGLSEHDVEAGDVLLDWRRNGYGLRYCHAVDEAELTALAHSAGLEVVELYYADGRSQKLNLFGVLRIRR